MKSVFEHPTIESLESRLLFAASIPSTVDLALIKVAAPQTAINISHHHVDGQLAAARVANLVPSPIKTKFTIQFYLSADQTFDSSDLLVGRAVAHPSLPAGGSKGFVGDLQPNANLAGGQYYLFAILKPAKGIVNSNAAGNIAMAANRVSIVHTHGSKTTDNSVDSNSADYYYCPDTTDDTSPTGDNSSTTQPAPETQPTTQPSDTQPTTQPDTQPTTDPASSDPPPSAPPSDSPPVDDSSSGDSGAVADDSSDF